jgi:hypothetical protein
MDDPTKPSRRDVLKVAGAAAATVATAGAAETGCASLPRVGAGPTIHPCDHPYCRYYRRVGAGGRCTLQVRLHGGRP